MQCTNIQTFFVQDLYTFLVPSYLHPRQWPAQVHIASPKLSSSQAEACSSTHFQSQAIFIPDSGLLKYTLPVPSHLHPRQRPAQVHHRTIAFFATENIDPDKCMRIVVFWKSRGICSEINMAFHTQFKQLLSTTKNRLWISLNIRPNQI